MHTERQKNSGRACDQEPIHIPGGVQSHGALVVLDAEARTIVAKSANAAELLQRPELDATDQARAALGERTIDALANLEAGVEGRMDFLPGFVELPGGDSLSLRIHRHKERLLLEFEPDGNEEEGTHFAELHEALVAMRAADSVERLARIAADSIRKLTGFERVMTYRFAEDWSGEVIAESASSATRYLGLRFPAGDIPAQARSLYVENPSRLIVDVRDPGSPLIPDTEEIDLTHAALRSVSEVHLRYLENMGVRASMSVSVIREGLWGLIACHHSAALHVPYPRRYASQLVAEAFAQQLAVLEARAEAEFIERVREMRRSVSERVVKGRSHRESLAMAGERMLNLVEAEGLAIVFGSTPVLLGATPNANRMRELASWLFEDGRSGRMVAESLEESQVPAQGFPRDISGMLAIPLSEALRTVIVWFRVERRRSVQWAGKPDSGSEEAHLDPRASFAAWTEEVRGKCEPWSAAHVRHAELVRDAVIEVLASHSIQLERLNYDLARSNEELAAFANAASHDLREPLRQIETLGSLLRGGFEAGGDDAEDLLDGISRAVRRMRALIDDLRDLSLVNASPSAMREVHLEETLAESLYELRSAIDLAEASVMVEDLPTVVGDAQELRRLFVHLISNALRYRSPERKAIVRIYADRAHLSELVDPLGERTVESPGFWTFHIEDNGIGIDEKFRELVFRPFERLSSDGEGSGIGLAICRKIVHRHGGEMALSSEPGVGSRFSFTLTQAEPNPTQGD